MKNQQVETSSQVELLRIIRQVRNRWRLKVALQGAAIVLGAGFLVFLLTAFAVGRLQRFARSGFKRPPSEHLDASLARML
jgi:hypothetical protein